jgi:actin-related protein
MRAFITQYVLEELQFASIYFLKSAVATCLGQGRATALVADSGHNFTTITKVHDGFQ